MPKRLLAALLLLLSFDSFTCTPNVVYGRPTAAAANQPTSQPVVELPLVSLDVRAFRLTQHDQYDRLIDQAAITWQLDPFLLKGLLYSESHFEATRINPRSGAAGIAQFTVCGRKGLAQIRRRRGCNDEFTRADALKPELAIPAAAELLNYLTRQWGPLTAVKHYNGGADKENFARRVLRQTNRYRTAAGVPPLPTLPRPRPPRPPLPVN